MAGTRLKKNPAAAAGEQEASAPWKDMDRIFPEGCREYKPPPDIREIRGRMDNALEACGEAEFRQLQKFAYELVARPVSLQLEPGPVASDAAREYFSDVRQNGSKLEKEMAFVTLANIVLHARRAQDPIVEAKIGELLERLGDRRTIAVLHDPQGKQC